jgi:hypothetical protein
MCLRLVLALEHNRHFFRFVPRCVLYFVRYETEIDLGGLKSRVMVDRYAKFATEHLSAAASRIESDRPKGNVVALSSYVFATVEKRKKV